MYRTRDPLGSKSQDLYLVSESSRWPHRRAQMQQGCRWLNPTVRRPQGSSRVGSFQSVKRKGIMSSNVPRLHEVGAATVREAHILCERSEPPLVASDNLSAVRCGEGHFFFSPPRVRTSAARAQRPSTAGLGRGAERVSRLLDEVPPRTATNSGRSIAARQTSRCKPCRARRHTSIHQRIATDRVRVPARRRGPALPAIVYLAFAKKRP